MGLSVSAAAVILFSGFLLSSLLVIQAVDTSFDAVQSSDDERFERHDTRLRTFIEIDQVTYYTTPNSLTMNITNTGSGSLSSEDIDVLVNGEIQTDSISTTTVDGLQTSLWSPGTTLSLTLVNQQTPQRVALVTGNGVSAFSFDIQVI